jgi:hypothetical protein
MIPDKQEIDLNYIYAEAWNTLDASLIIPYLADDVLYTSQNVFSSLKGREEVAHYLLGKMETILNSSDRSVKAEMGFCGSQEGYRVMVWAAWENRPCVILYQGSAIEPIALVILETKNNLIQEIGICTVVPHPSTASKTGIFPGRVSDEGN